MKHILFLLAAFWLSILTLSAQQPTTAATALLRQANNYMSKGDYKNAKAKAEAVLSIDKTNSEAKRNIKQGGISVNDSKITDFAASFDKSAFEKDFIIKKGKKDYHKIILK